jgi:hypothetical protein
MIPGNKSNKRGDRRARQNKSSGRGSAVDHEFVNSQMAVGKANVCLVAEDFIRKPQSWQIGTSAPPRNFLSQVHWTQATVTLQQSISGSTDTELNFLFSLSAITQLSGIAGYFDQFCIYAVTISATPQPNQGAGGTYGVLCTAIDYDNNSNLGSLPSVQSFGTSEDTILNAGQSVQRFLKPCVSPALYGGSTFSSFGIGRMWVDSASPATPHYGYRSYYRFATTGFTMTYTIAYIIGFRNNI